MMITQRPPIGRRCKIIGYVIMPNHIHVLIDFIKTHQTINTIIGNGKRFMAYDRETVEEHRAEQFT